MNRQPYQRQQSKFWYLSSRFYRWYMLRELTSLTTAFAALNLFWGLAALASSLESWQCWLNAQKSTFMITLNLIAIAGSLLNSKTWFEAMPKAVRIPKGNGFVAAETLVKGSWIAFGSIFVILCLIIIILA